MIPGPVTRLKPLDTAVVAPSVPTQTMYVLPRGGHRGRGSCHQLFSFRAHFNVPFLLTEKAPAERKLLDRVSWLLEARTFALFPQLLYDTRRLPHKPFRVLLFIRILWPFDGPAF